MSTTTESKVVEMRFDNQNFERNVKTTMDSLNKLKKNLDFSKSSDSLNELDTASKRVNFAQLGNAVDSVKVKFSYLNAMAISTLVNISNNVISTVKTMSSQFTTQPIKDGFREYETQMGAIQTILANTSEKGSTLNDVNKALDTLNTYADKTIYNFTEMTRNIGTFTAAGIGLEESTKAIEGIANLAAVSGSTSQQASTAMYQLSQALSSGTLKLQDWNSVVNASMGGQVFQNALKDTARAHGIAVDAMIEKNGSFRESLQEGWITSEILTETLSKMTKTGAAEYLSKLTGITQKEIEAAQKSVATNKNSANGYDKLAEKMAATGSITAEEAVKLLKMADNAEDAATKVKTFTQLIDTLKEAIGSGWTNSWEMIVGDFGEAKELFTSISDYLSGDNGIITKSAEMRNSIIKDWKSIGGRKAILDGLINTFNAVVSVATPIRDAFREIFPPITGKTLAAWSQSFKDFTATLILSEESSEKLKTTFKGLFSIFDTVLTFSKDIVLGVKDIGSNFKGLGSIILDTAAWFGEMLQKWNKSVHDYDMMAEIMKKISKVVGLLVNGFKTLVTWVDNLIQMPKFEALLKIFNNIYNGISKVVNFILDKAVAIGKKIPQIIDPNILSIENLIRLGHAFNTGILSAILININGLTKSTGKFSKLISSFTDISNAIKDVFTEVKDCLKAYQDDIKANTLTKIAKAVATLAAAIFVLSLIDPVQLGLSLGAISTMFAELMGSMYAFTKMDGLSNKAQTAGMIKMSVMLTALAKSILLMSVACKILASMDMEQLAKGLGAIGIMMFEISAFMNSTSFQEVPKGFNKSLKSLAVSMVIFAASMKIIATMSPEEIAESLVAIGALFFGIEQFMNNVHADKNITKVARSMILMGASMAVFAAVMKIIVGIDYKNLGKALSAIYILGYGIQQFINNTNTNSKSVATAFSMIAIATSMVIFAKTMNEFAKNDWNEIFKGLVSMGSIMLMIGALINYTKDDSSVKMIATATSLVLMGGAMNIVADAMGKIGNLSDDQVIKSLVGLGGALGIIAVALQNMQKTVGGSTALLIAAMALGVLTPVIKTLGSMGIDQIGKALLALGGVFVIIGVSATVLAPVVPIIIALAASLVLLSTSVTLMGAGVMLLATGMALMSTVTTVAATSMIAALTVIVSGLAQMVPIVVEAIGNMIIGILEVMQEAAPVYKETMLTLLEVSLDAITESIPLIASELLKLITSVLDVLAQNAPTITGKLFDLIIGILEAFRDKLPDVIAIGVELIGAIFEGVIKGLDNLDTETILKGIESVGVVTVLLAKLAVLSVLAPLAAVGIVEFGLLVVELSAVLAAVGLLSKIPGLTWIIGEGRELLSTMGLVLGEFVGNLIAGIGTTLTSGLPAMADNLSLFMERLTPFLDGAKQIDQSVLDSVKTLAEIIILLTAADFISSITSFLTGDDSFADFADKLTPLGKGLKAFSDEVSGINKEAVTAAADAAKSLAEMASDIPNTGGLLGKIFGENDVDDFGNKLEAFGKGIKKFDTAVKGISSKTIENAANAGKTLTSLADTVPNSGGWSGAIFGENDLDDFGDKLEKFGVSIMKFQNSVTGIKSDIVQEAATAGEALTALNDSMPNIGGFVSLFTGDNTMEAFGEELVNFGEYFKEYADTVSTIKTDILQKSTDAAESIVSIQNAIPKNGLFSGNMSLEDFGEELEDFGSYFYEYYNNVKTINTRTLDSVTNALIKVVDLGTRMASVDTSGMSGFSEAFVTLAEKGIDNFISTFKDSESKVRIAMFNAITNAENAIRLRYDNFYRAGEYIIDGFVKGIKSKLPEVKNAATQIGKDAEDATKKATDEHSPSKVFEKIGKFVVEGFVRGIDKNGKLVKKSSENMAKIGINATKSVMKSLKSSNSIFKEYYEDTDENGKKVGITMDRAADAFVKFRDSVKDSLSVSGGLFDEFTTNVEANVTSMLGNMQSQINGITNWAVNLKVLSDRGLSKALLKELYNMGTAGAGYIEQLTTMTDTQLKKFQSLYNKRIKISSDAANVIAGSFLEASSTLNNAFKMSTETLLETKTGQISTVGTVSKSIKDILNWTFSGAKTSIAQTMDYGKGVFEQFTKRYLTSTKNITIGNKVLTETKKLIEDYGTSLWKSSQYYETDMANRNILSKSLSDYEKERARINKEISKNSGKNTKESNAYVYSLKKRLKDVDKAIKETKDTITANENLILQHTKEVFNAMRNTIKDTVSAYLDPMKLSMDSGVDLFGSKYETNEMLLKEDKKNLEEHKKTLEELEKSQKELQDKIAEDQKLNTIASRRRVQQFSEELDEIQSKIETTMSQIEEDENNIKSHSSITAESIIENMTSQVKGVKSLQDSLKKLEKTNISKGLLDKLKSMGVSGANYIDQFLKMTNKQIEEANTMYKKAQNLSAETLIQNFKDKLNNAKNWAADMQTLATMGFNKDIVEQIGNLGLDGYDTLKTFLSMTKAQVKEFNSEYSQSLKLPDSVADEVISAYAMAGSSSVKEFTNSLKTLTKDGSDENKALKSTIAEINKVVNSQVKSNVTSTTKSMITAITKELKNNSKTIKNNFGTTGADAISALATKLNAATGTEISKNVINGITSSIKAKKNEIVKTFKELGKTAYNATKEALQIHSPSRKFGELGQYSIAGFVNSILNGEGLVKNSAVTVMSKAITAMNDAINVDVDSRPTIRPVLDLTDIHNGVSEIGSLMSGQSISNTLDLANANATTMSSRISNVDLTMSQISELQRTLSNMMERPNIEQTNNFQITGDDPQAIANEVSHILQTQVNRRSAVWGM